MNWNNFPHPPPPPTPPGPPPPGPPPPSYSHSPFWNFINSFGPSPGPANHPTDPGYGVDHAESPHGFTFGPAGFNAWSGRHGFRGNWGGRGGRRGGRYDRDRCQHCHSNTEKDTSGTSSSDEDEDMYDITDPAAAKTPDTESPASQEGVTLDEKGNSPATMQDGEHPDPPEEVPTSLPHRGRHGGLCGGRGRHGHGPFGDRGGRHGGRHGPHRGDSHGRRHHHHHHHHRGSPGPPGAGGPPPPFPFSFPWGGAGGPRGGGPGGPGGPGGDGFDFNAMMNALADHPFARGLRQHWEEVQQNRQQRRERGAAARADGNNRGEEHAMERENDTDSGTFVPPVDIFNTANNWILHVSVPGAKKEDVNVHWDADRSTLGISGLVYRPGDEEFLNTLVSAERRVGLFERRVQLPPLGGVARDEDGEKEEVDADHITARMEDGILVVVVPKVEKEWTEVKKVDIE